MLISTWTARSLQRRGASSVIPIPVHGDAQRPTQRRSARRRPAAPSTATCSRCCGNARRGAPWRAQRMARARRTARAPSACSSVEAAARTTHATRSAHAMCVMVGVHLAASTRPRRAGRRRAGPRRWARHRDCAATREHMTFESLEFAGVCFGAESFSWYKMVTRDSKRWSARMLVPGRIAHFWQAPIL